MIGISKILMGTERLVKQRYLLDLAVLTLATGTINVN